jgi:hypothetical protein
MEFGNFLEEFGGKWQPFFKKNIHHLLIRITEDVIIDLVGWLLSCWSLYSYITIAP